ncbi:uncharacterized protein LOC117282232 [Cryptotermes secundus]|uniref:uncharacterized protein LOC117282232 n=1 Tax=Cryptotermes secundus TaxID=105785 RepID=UPI001454BB74|nr:uncharacterized protein LOC117282232 [Cryptotermes secundus]
MEDFEERALDLAPHKPRCWFRYVYDTFVIWPHGPNKLKDFLNHLISICQYIRFTMENEIEGHLPFLDIDIYRRPDGSLSHRVYRKSTHTNCYLIAVSHHHPSNKQAVFSALVHRARALSNHKSLHAESVLLGDIFRQNGHNTQQIYRVLSCHPSISWPDNEPFSVAFLPYVGTIFNQISRVLSWHIRSVGLPPTKVSSFLRPVKESLGLRTPGVYRIPCKCGKVYIGQTGCSIDTRLKDHQWHIRLEDPDKSAVAGHSINMGHHIQFQNTSILATKIRYMGRFIRETIEIELHPDSMNREGWFCLSKSWKPLISSLKNPPGHDARSTRPRRSIPDSHGSP